MEEILKCEMCEKQDAIVKEMGYKLCPPCDKGMSKAYDVMADAQNRDCPKCGKAMQYLDAGNFAELNTYWFECKCGHTEDV